jgi:hypothetical protein
MVSWAARTFLVLGAVALVGAFAWWAILFPGVMLNTGLGLSQALPCVASDSTICSLAMSLCGGQHLFGVRRYTPELFWIGLMASSLGLALIGLRPSQPVRGRP